MKPRKAIEQPSAETHGGAPRPRHRFRMRVVLWAFLLTYAVVAGRLAQLQLHPDVKLTKQDLGHVAQMPISVPRGTIYDSSGVVLATDKTVYSIWVDPRRVEDEEAMAQRLSEALGLDLEEVRGRLKKTDDSGNARMFSWIRRWMAKEEIEALGDLKTNFGDGLHVRPEPLRFYPQGDLAAHVVGFTSLERAGVAGIEVTCEKYLNSKEGVWKSRADAKRNLLSSLTLEYQEPQGGCDVTLTIDAVLQQSLERELDKALVSSKAPRGLGIVMNPKTGAILALACRPSYDPNRFWDYEPEQRKNRALVDTFEPGSSFKIVTAAAALEQKLVTPNEMIDCENGGFNPYGHYIRDFHPHGVIPFSEAFAESSNVAIIKVGKRLGPEGMKEWIRRFGFGQRTSAELTGEGNGIIPGRLWSKLTMGSLPMGQEISVTVPQLARAFCAIANGGYLVQPYLIDSVTARDGSYAYLREPPEPVRILSQETADTMRELCHSVAREGTGTAAAIPEYRVGGKTGTAQISLERGGYIPGKFTAIFAGFAPIADPKLCAVIVVQEPDIKLHFGGYICGPVFREVVRNALIRMNCPKDPDPSVKTPTGTPDESDADTVVARAGRPVKKKATGELTLAPIDNLELPEFAEDSPLGGPVMPNLKGLTKAQAMERVGDLGLPWEPTGSGRVVSQEPAPGTPLDQVTLCRLVFDREERTETPSAN